MPQNDHDKEATIRHTVTLPHAPHAPNKRRIHELDFLRGFFIVVIIIDHLQRWPNPFSYITGEGRLWVSAAEGFFIISGLLIGYLRGYKGMRQSFHTLTKLLVKRAATLYIWSVFITCAAVFIISLGRYNEALLPKLPDVGGFDFIWSVLTQQYVFDWIYFLRLYWMMMLLSPLAIWAFRSKRWFLVPIISIAVYISSLFMQQPEAALQWQVLFFVAATIGFHFEHILDYFAARPQLKRAVIAASIGLMLITMVLSYFWVLGWKYVESDHPQLSRDTYVSVRVWLDAWFTNSPLAIGRVTLAFVWFTGLLSLFHVIKPQLEKYARWLLTPLGTYSLTSYTVQAIALIPVQLLIPASPSPIINVVIVGGMVVIVRYLTTQHHVHRILPQ